MSQTRINLWFVCKLCRESFGQVDSFIEHKKDQHFNEFRKTSHIVFEESEYDVLSPVILKAENPLTTEITEPPIKVEVNEAENIVFGLKQTKQNPYVLLQRLTSQEIQTPCNPQHCSRLILKCEQEIFDNSSEHSNSSKFDSHLIDDTEVEKSTETQSTSTVTNMSTEYNFKFQCNLCSKQLESDGQRRIHVGICALYHQDRNRFCVKCNKKLGNERHLKLHHVRFHGTEEEKSTMFKFKCHLCPKNYRSKNDLEKHLKSHIKKKQVEILKLPTKSKSKSLKCPQPNCRKEFASRSGLWRHNAAVHFGRRPYSCPYPNCNKFFMQRGNLTPHLLIHTGECPFKCTVNKCKSAFRTAGQRSAHLEKCHPDRVLDPT